MNIRGLSLKCHRTKVSELSDKMSINNSIGMALTETWLKPEILDAEIHIPGYNIFRSDRIKRIRGGAALYLKEDLNAKKFYEFSNDAVEFLVVKCQKLDTLFVVIYRPPDTLSNEWNQALTSLEEAINMAQANGKFKTLLISGDYNFRTLNWAQGSIKLDQSLNFQQEKLAIFMSNFCLFNVVTSPTRENTILDLVLTNDLSFVTKVKSEINVGFSDHNLVICELSVSLEPQSIVSERINYFTKIPSYNLRNGSEDNWKCYTSDMESVDWWSLADNLNCEQKLLLLYEKIESSVKGNFQKMETKMANQKRKIPKLMRTLYRRKSKISRNLLRTKCKDKLIKLRVNLKKIETEIKVKQENWRMSNESKAIEEIKINPGAFYRYARKKAVIKHKIGPLRAKDGLLYNNEEKMSNILADQYENICSKPTRNIESPEFLEELFCDDNSDGPKLDNIYVDRDTIRKTISKLSNNSAVGPDGIPIECLKKGGDTIIDAIEDITRTSIDEGTIPKILKLAWITPIWKGTDKELPSDYRPISLTSHVGKIVERLVRIAITNFLTANNLIEEEQHGSRSGRGTLSQLLVQQDLIIEKLSQGRNVDIVYLDFSKAFDLVDFPILLNKLKLKGIRGKLLNWILCFLKEREQRVRINDNLSSPFPLRSGVPQGSVLGPLLFLIFIEDLGDTLNKSVASILKYVDDSKLIGDLKNVEDVDLFQSELNEIYTWATRNNMVWNKLKFQLLRLGKNSNITENTSLFTPDFQDIIERKECIKDLGIMVDDQVSYSIQKQKALMKAKQKIGWILRCFKTRSVSFLRILWNSLVQPHLDYGSIIWSPVDSKGELKAFEDPLRSLTKKAEGTSQLNYWERLKIFKLYSNQRRMERYKCLYIWKSLHGFCPSLGLVWKQFDGSRNGPTLMLPKIIGTIESCKTLQKRSLRWEGVKIFNSLPNELKTWKGTPDTFKKLLDSYLTTLPDQPLTPSLSPGAETVYGIPSNSITDWARKFAGTWTLDPDLDLPSDTEMG